MTPLLTRLRRMSADQDQCITAEQLFVGGVSRGGIASLTARGAISHVVHGSFVVASDHLTMRQALRTGLLVGGPGSSVGGRTNAEFRQLIRPAPHALEIVVPLARRNRRLTTALPLDATGRPVEISLRRSRMDPRHEVIDRMPLTSVGYMLVALAASDGGEIAWRAWREADYQRLLDPTDVLEACGPGRAGSRIVRALADALPIVQTEETQAQTEAEFRLIEQLLMLGFPRPHSNVPLRLDHRWYYPDLWWRELNAVIEVDGPVHQRPRRARDDALRDRHMQQHGIHVRRYRRDDVLANPAHHAADAGVWLSSLPKVPWSASSV